MRLGAAICVAAAFAVAAAVTFGGGRASLERPAHRAAERVAPGELLERTYMGVSCPRPNSIACDRIGLAVWLREDAEAVTAEIDGRRFELDDPEWGHWPQAFAGYLRPAGLRDGELQVPVRAGRSRWLGSGDVAARVRLWIRRDDGTRITEVVVPLRAGWG